MAKNFISYLLNSLGYRLKKVNRTAPDRRIDDPRKVADLRNASNDPRQISYLQQTSALADLPVDLGCRTNFALKDSSDPFRLAVAVAVTSKDPPEVIRSVLEHYYSLVQPINACEWLGVDPGQCPDLAEVPPWAAPDPWREKTISEQDQHVRRYTGRESERERHALSITEGWTYCGPVSEEKLEMESGRLHRLMSSIQSKGFEIPTIRADDLTASLLVDNSGNWRWVVENGKHRASVLSALGYKSVPVRVKLVVHRSDAEAWPNVTSGVYTKEAALKYFDRFFSEDSPPVVHRWDAEARKKWMSVDDVQKIDGE